MPELPEVEVVRLALRKVLINETLEKVAVFSDWKNIPEGFKKLQYKTVRDVVRHGKYLFFYFGSHGKANYLMSHLGMSGSYRIAKPDDRVVQKHDHFGFMTTKNRIYYNDPRRFGRLELLSSLQLPELAYTSDDLIGLGWYDLGPDALCWNLTGRGLDHAVKIWKRQLSLCMPTTLIKDALLNQGVVAGIGNIYACEILFYIGVRPTRPLGQLTSKEIKKLAKYTPKVLNWALINGGTTFRGSNQYVSPTGEKGSNVNELKVYDREHKTCFGCESKIVKTVIAGRGTYYCPTCQS